MTTKNFDQEYNRKRAANTHFNYRLRRRTDEVIRAIYKHHPLSTGFILDIGAADGLMLSRIKKKFPKAKCVGLEYSLELIAANKDRGIKIIHGDAHNLPFPDNSFDIAIASAVIEHMERPEKMLREARRVLKKEGILIVTTAVPFFEKIARIIGHLKNDELLKGEQHHTMFNIRKLKEYFREGGFRILQTDKFLISPVGLPAEIKIEKLIKFFRLDFVLLNQLIVGRK